MPDPTPVPDDVHEAIARASTAASGVLRLEGELEAARTGYYDAVAEAVDAARTAGITTAQALVARELGISRQRVSELSRRTPAAS